MYFKYIINIWYESSLSSLFREILRIFSCKMTKFKLLLVLITAFILVLIPHLRIPADTSLINLYQKDANQELYDPGFLSQMRIHSEYDVSKAIEIKNFKNTEVDHKG